MDQVDDEQFNVEAGSMYLSMEEIGPDGTVTKKKIRKIKGENGEEIEEIETIDEKTGKKTKK